MDETVRDEILENSILDRRRGRPRARLRRRRRDYRKPRRGGPGGGPRQLPLTERIALQRSLDYPEDTAGRRMQTEFIAVPPFWTVGQTIDFMRETADLPETFYEIFVVDPAGHLLGAVPLDRLLRSKRPVTIQEIMNDEPDRVEATEDQEEVARLFERYNLVSAGVVDEGGRLVGTSSSTTSST